MDKTKARDLAAEWLRSRPSHYPTKGRQAIMDAFDAGLRAGIGLSAMRVEARFNSLTHPMYAAHAIREILEELERE